MSSAEQTISSRPERRAPRERAFLSGSISYGGGALSTPCTVMQLSPTGAKLSVAATISLPEVFQIVIAQKSIDRRAKLIWRKADTAAVAFEPEEKPAELPAGESARGKIAALQAENDRLKARVGELSAQIARLTDL